jgi:hypothetical protein
MIKLSPVFTSILVEKVDPNTLTWPTVALEYIILAVKGEKGSVSFCKNRIQTRHFDVRICNHNRMPFVVRQLLIQLSYLDLWEVSSIE